MSALESSPSVGEELDVSPSVVEVLGFPNVTTLLKEISAVSQQITRPSLLKVFFFFSRFFSSFPFLPSGLNMGVFSDPGTCSFGQKLNVFDWKSKTGRLKPAKKSAAGAGRLGCAALRLVGARLRQASSQCC